MMQRTIAWAAGCVLVLSAFVPIGCGTDKTFSDRQPYRQRSAHPLFLLSTPNDLAEEFLYPDPPCVQSFIWGPMGAEWRVRLNHLGYAHSGFGLRRPKESPGRREEYALAFRLTPSSAADSLSLGLAYGERTNSYIVTSRAISDYKWRDSQPPWTAYAIPIKAFTNAPDMDVFPDGRFPEKSSHWDIIEVYLFKLGDEPVHERLGIQNLRVLSTLGIEP
ncbi:MAG: hypothetical protein KJ626_14225 [Verrucomicrobia bacterium]|nr:hypothetical protein [Verrucomicrobiota bacterium]